jgi:hypothetical protein
VKLAFGCHAANKAGICSPLPRGDVQLLIGRRISIGRSSQVCFDVLGHRSEFARLSSKAGMRASSGGMLHSFLDRSLFPHE